MATPPLPRKYAEEAVNAVHQCGDISSAARHLNLPRSTLDKRLDTARRLYGLKIPDGFDRIPRPSGHSVRAATTEYDGDGKLKRQWVKSDAIPSMEDLAKLVKEVFADTIPIPRIKKPTIAPNKLFTVFPIGDHHVSMYAYAAETGADYDVKIAKRLLTNAAKVLVDGAPASDRCLIANVGDFFHTDNFKNETPISGHHLDTDTRYSVMIKSGVEMMRAFIECALGKFNTVEVLNAAGNHDPVGAAWLSLTLALLYEKNPRVKVDTSPAKFAYFRHGSTLIGVTHGDMRRADALPGIMAADRPEDWGATKHRYWLTGHIHQRKVIEHAGCMVESFRTLAARDAWATASGYRSGRDMTSITFHAEHGEFMRQRCDISMLE